MPALLPWFCVYVVSFSVEHVLSCPQGGFLFVQHNEICDSITHLLKEICHDVCIEPGLQLLNGENMSYCSAVKDDGICLDIAAHGFWGISHQQAYFDAHVFNPYAPSYHSSSLSFCFHCNEQQKRRVCDQRVHDVEMGCFSPLVCLTVGGCGPTANVILKRLASCIATRQWKSQPHTLLASLPLWILLNTFSCPVFTWLPFFPWTLA